MLTLGADTGAIVPGVKFRVETETVGLSTKLLDSTVGPGKSAAELRIAIAAKPDIVCSLIIHLRSPLRSLSKSADSAPSIRVRCLFLNNNNEHHQRDCAKRHSGGDHRSRRHRIIPGLGQGFTPKEGHPEPGVLCVQAGSDQHLRPGP